MIKTGVVHGRFQVMHLKHMEYIMAAKMRCSKLFIGITNPDSMHTRESANDISRAERSANPLTYFERYEMIRGAMADFNIQRRNMILSLFQSVALNIFSSMSQRTRYIIWGCMTRGMRRNIRS